MIPYYWNCKVKLILQIDLLDVKSVKRQFSQYETYFPQNGENVSVKDLSY